MEIKKCELCNKCIVTDTHHIQSTSKDGEDRPYNKCELCPNCHREVHTGNIILEGRFFTTACKKGTTELVWRNKGEESITGLKDPDVWTYEKKIIEPVIYPYKESEVF